jgi:hypothetical protein
MFALRPFPDVPTHRYKIYGLSIVSDLRLPELPEDEGDGEAGRPHLGRGRSGKRRRYILWARRCSAFTSKASLHTSYATGGGSLSDPAPMRLERKRSALSARLCLRHTAAPKRASSLHANAIEIDGHAVAFMGETGAGNRRWRPGFMTRGIGSSLTTFASWTSAKVGKIAFAFVRAMPRIRLWKDALERSGRVSADYEFSYAGDESYEKFDVPVSRSAAPRLIWTGRNLRAVDPANRSISAAIRG